MPTPFTHTAALIRLLDDEQFPAVHKHALQTERPAYLLGSVAPDARPPGVADPRAATHFYTYQEGITTAPWRVMMNRYPTLNPPQNAAHRAFLAGYIGHLAMDEIWTKNMLVPHFANGKWGENIHHRFFLLHLMLIEMDERDLAWLPAWAAADLKQAEPGENWLPFIPTAVLADWRDLIYEQIKPNGESKTYEIFGSRVGKEPQELQRLAADTTWMAREIWQHVSRQVLAVIEAQMYTHARQSVMTYLTDFAGVRPE